MHSVASLTLIVGGLILLAWGGWLFYRYQFEASVPRHVRVVDVAEAEPVEIATSQLRSTRAESTVLSVATPTPHPTFAPTPKPPPSTPETVAPSLADNPLPVVEAETPLQATATPGEVNPAVSTPTRIVANSINLDAKVVKVGWKQVIENGVPTNVWEVANYAAGWHKNSKLPGQGGNIVLSGHNNIKGEVFRYLVDLKPGDGITLFVGEKLYEYTTTDIFILKDKGEPEAVRRENAKWIGSFNDERLTLVTCWPYINNTHRLIVIARPLPK
ncbi:MAG: hypothetical protein BroJett011_13730 [Chloroflexota bacterium]|nr:MAG: hypothetical protein BroJett011_13730 [Chloroflexota bacterium]